MIIAKEDSGATNNYVKLEDAPEILSNLKPNNGPEVFTPNGDTMKSNQSGHLKLNTALSATATQADILDGLQNNLMPLGKLCDD